MVHLFYTAKKGCFPMGNVDTIYHELTNVDIETQRVLWDERGKGYYGEYLVFKKLYPNISGTCKILMNLQVPAAYGKTTEIDLVLIHESGLYVFEVKHYKGTIYGKPAEAKWTQYFRTTANHTFRNPVEQNRYHIQALRNRFPNLPIYSYIVFTNEECELKVESGDPNLIICKLSELAYETFKITTRPSILNIHQIDNIFRELIPFSPITHHNVLVDGMELPFHAYFEHIVKDYKSTKSTLEESYRTQSSQCEKEHKSRMVTLENSYSAKIIQCETDYQRKAKVFSLITSAICAGALIVSILICSNTKRQSSLQIEQIENQSALQVEQAQKELASFAQKFEFVEDFNSGDLHIKKDLVTAFDVLLEPSDDLANTLNFSCSLEWHGENYGVSIGEKASLVVLLNNGTVQEYMLFNDVYPFSRNTLLGKYNVWYGGNSQCQILLHEFYDITLESISSIKLANLDIWTDVSNDPVIVANGYEIELYRN